MKCKYREKGCNAPIPIKCSDYCIIKNLKIQIENLEREKKQLLIRLSEKCGVYG